MKTKILALSAVAALALPAAAPAAKPAKAQKQQAPKAQKVGFSLNGVLSQGGTDFPTFTAIEDKSAFTDSFQADLLSANKHARTALAIQKSAIKGDAVTVLDDFTGTDAFTLTYVGFGEDKTLAAGDTVKVIGKVTRTRSGKGKSATYSYSNLDVRKVVITREAPEA